MEIRKTWRYPTTYHGIISKTRQVLTTNIKPKFLIWDTKVPPGVTVHDWRRFQLRRYIECYPEHKPKNIIVWIKAQKTNPWPKCTTKEISRLLNVSTRSSQFQFEQLSGGLEIQSAVSCQTYCKVHQQDFSMPSTTNVGEHRHIQVRLYLEMFANSTPMEILNWMSTQNPHPWPECTRDVIKGIRQRQKRESTHLKLQISSLKIFIKINALPL